jgi:hypothetical protein
MKRTMIAFCCLLGGLTGLYAQKSDTLSRWQLSISSGPSIPIGKFGSKNINDAQSAFAKTGAVLGLTAGYRVGRYWGISLTVDGESHQVDDHVASNRMDALNSTTGYFYGSTPWRMGRGMVGLFGEFPLDADGQWEWIAGVSTGALVTALPSVYILEGNPSSGAPTPLSNGTYAGTYFTDDAMRWAFAYDGRLGFRYNLDHVFFDLQADYAAATLNTPYTKTSLGSQVSEGQEPSAGGARASSGNGTAQPLASVNIRFGLGLMF